MLIAIAILAVSVSALVVLIPIATQSNTLSRWDSAGVVYAQRLLEQMRARPVSVNSFVDQDSKTINMAAGGCPLTAAGNIDWSVACTGYTATYTEADNPQAPVFEVRWNVQVHPVNGGKLVTIAARKVGAGVGRGVQLPATLKLFITR